jgi:hypothetical protein
MIAVVLEIVLLLFSDLTFTSILWISLVVTALAYIIGDLFILPATNNLVATIADIGLSLVIIYLFNFFWNTNDIPFLSALVAAVVIGVGEWFFHKFIDRKVEDDHTDRM